MKADRLQFPLEIIKISSFILLTILFVNCSGPEGPMGPRGYDGQDGLDGLDGLDGTTPYSIIFDVEPSAWSGDADGYDAFLDVPAITDDVYYDGVVLVYRLIEIDPKSFNMLPYTFVDNALAVYMDFDAYVGTIDLMYKEVFDGVNDTPAPDEVWSFKVLIIEGIPLATLKSMVDVSDFKAVSRLLNMNNNTITIQ